MDKLLSLLTLKQRIFYEFYNFFQNKEWFSLSIYGEKAKEEKYFFGFFIFRKGKQFHLRVFCSPNGFLILQDVFLRNQILFFNEGKTIA